MKIFELPSEHGHLRGAIWDNVENPKGTIQIAHGLVEYHDRYDEFAKFLNEHGYIVYCNDHLGHGLHVKKGELKGYFADENGYEAVVDQLAEMNSVIRKAHPSLNHFFIGHSLGTALGLSFLKRNISFEAVILSAPFTNHDFILFLFGILVWPEYKFQGKRAVSMEMEKHTSLKHNSFFKPNRTPHDYLSRDHGRVDSYVEDELCGFPKTTQMWLDLKSGFGGLWTKNSYKEIDPETRVLIVTGDKDPINNNGKQAERMHNSFIDVGLNSEIEVYPDMRHEPLNEIGREEVFKRMESFFSKQS